MSRRILAPDNRTFTGFTDHVVAHNGTANGFSVTIGANLLVTSTDVFVTAVTTSSFFGWDQTTYSRILLARWDKQTGERTGMVHIGDDADAASVRYNYFGALRDDPQGYLAIVTGSSLTAESIMLRLNSSLQETDEIDAGLGASSVSNLFFYANGDAVVINSGADPLITVLDESAGTPYTTVIRDGIMFTANSIASGNEGAIDDSNNIYLPFFEGTNPAKATILKINSAGAVAASATIYRYGDASDTNYPNSNLVLDASGDIYFAWRAMDNSVSSTTYDILVTKLNSSLAEQWTVKISTSTTTQNHATRIAVSPDGNYLYVLLCMGVFNSADAYVLSLNVSDGTEAAEWNITDTNGRYFAAGQNIKTDSTNVYVARVVTDASGYYQGPAILSLSQSAFEAGGTFGLFTISPSSYFTVTDQTANTTTGTSSETISSTTTTSTTTATVNVTSYSEGTNLQRFE